MFKKLSIIIFLLLTCITLFAQEENDQSDSQIQQANYILGFQEGSSLKRKLYILDIPSFKQGMEDGFNNHIPDEIENKRDTITSTYISWIFNKSTSTFHVTDLDKKSIQMFSYIVGSDYGKDFKEKYFPLELDQFIQGLSDALSEVTPAYDIQNYSIMTAFYNKVDNIKQEISSNKVAKSLHAQKFNRELEDGISYTLITPGKNTLMTTSNSEITIQYILSRITDSDHIQNIKVENLSTMNIKDLAPGVQIAIRNMQEGEHSIFSIPSNLLVLNEPKNSPQENLILDITLISINSNSIDTPTKKSLDDMNTAIPDELNKNNLLDKKKNSKKNKQ